MRHRAAEDEAPRFDARDLVDPPARERMNQFIHRAAERPGVAEQGGDVPKDDTGLRIIRNRPDGGFQIGEEALVHGKARVEEAHSIGRAS
jgi:hypothetical protein